MPDDKTSVTTGRTVLGAPSLSVNPPDKPKMEPEPEQEQEKTTRLPSRSKASPPQTTEDEKHEAPDQDDDKL